MNQGWECPKCGKCYAPFVRECDACGIIKEFKKMFPGTTPGTISTNCLNCGGYHPGMMCPHMTPMSSIEAKEKSVEMPIDHEEGY